MCGGKVQCGKLLTYLACAVVHLLKGTKTSAALCIQIFVQPIGGGEGMEK